MRLCAWQHAQFRLGFRGLKPDLSRPSLSLFKEVRVIPVAFKAAPEYKRLPIVREPRLEVTTPIGEAAYGADLQDAPRELDSGAKLGAIEPVRALRRAERVGVDDGGVRDRRRPRGLAQRLLGQKLNMFASLTVTTS